MYVINGLATSYSCRGKPPTTIGAEELNFRVRDGNGCDLFAFITRPCSLLKGQILLYHFSRNWQAFYLFFQNRINETLCITESFMCHGPASAASCSGHKPSSYAGQDPRRRSSYACRSCSGRFGTSLRRSPRSISIRQLHVSPHFHPGPIHLVIFEGSYQLALWEISS